MKKKRESVVRAVRLGAALDREVARLAREQGVSMSVVTRLALERGLSVLRAQLQTGVEGGQG